MVPGHVELDLACCAAELFKHCACAPYINGVHCSNVKTDGCKLTPIVCTVSMSGLYPLSPLEWHTTTQLL